MEEVLMKEGYLPKEQRKKILLLSDDLRMPSGVGVMSREMVVGTAHRFNWVQLGAAVTHPEAGKVIDASQSLTVDTGIPDPYLMIYPYNGYGDPNAVRQLMMREQPDAIMHFTDPRYWIWLYEMEHEIREHCPLMFYHVWDDLPFPRYNEDFYRSCDFIAGISRQTYNIVRQVWKKDTPETWQVKYVPHGINEKLFFKTTDDESKKRSAEMRQQMFNGEEIDFVVLYNNRNIRRKMTGDVILAYKEFWKTLTEQQRKRTRLLMHTQPVDENGTDLIALLRDVAPEIDVVFSAERVDTTTMNLIYDNADVVINLASNEGFGLGTLEAMMAEKMIIVNVTGGLQDQCGFKNEAGDFIHEDREYGADWGSNHDGRFREHGEWVVPVFPNNRALIGSPPTPYIFDDRCSWQDAARAIREVYNMGPEDRARRGALGRQYALTEGYSAKGMCDRFIEGIDTTLANWTPRARFTLHKGE
jgi:glycosyltransferase involved in cell wall biosynthesis